MSHHDEFNSYDEWPSVPRTPYRYRSSENRDAPKAPLFAPIEGMKLIGLGHKARHGKDTACSAIVTGVPGAMRFSFADDLYAVCRALYGMTAKDPVLLQRVGMEVRDKDADTWIRAVYSKMLDKRPRLAVITDVRFENEFEFVNALGGITVRVSRFNMDGNPFVDPSRPATHVSETALDNHPWDITLRNTGVDRLRRNACNLGWKVLKGLPL